MRRFAPAVVAVLALVAIFVAWSRLDAATAPLDVTASRVGDVPVTVFSSRGVAPGPTVVIAHGFAGSQQLMQPFAITLARNGYRAITFDFPGHGRNPVPFVARIEDEERRLQLLSDALEAVIRHTATLPGADGRVALLGHSMAGDVLVRHAAAHRDEVPATVLVSPYIGRGAPTGEVRNLQFVFGALEPRMLHETARTAIGGSNPGEVRAGEVYGRFDDGTARSLVLVDGAEHIGVLYAQGGLASARDWLDASFARRGDGYVDSRGAALTLLFAGLLALAWPLSQLLPRAANASLGAGLPWRRLWPLAIAPALATPIVLRFVPTGFLPILLGDYLALHFALYGIVTALGIFFVRRASKAATARTLWPGLVVAAAATTAYAMLVFAWPIDRYLTSFVPVGQRAVLMLAMLPATLAYFAADAWLVRGANAARGGVAFTRLLFLLSLLLAVALNLRALFFLVIIVPAMLAFFLVYGLLESWAYRRTWHPWVGAVALALAFAWAIASTFPIVARTG
jgi:pimeloyl-ACP methyl ester carboxylesterase